MVQQDCVVIISPKLLHCANTTNTSNVEFSSNSVSKGKSFKCHYSIRKTKVWHRAAKLVGQDCCQCGHFCIEVLNLWNTQDVKEAYMYKDSKGVQGSWARN